MREDRWTHLRWWKSWNSGEGRRGRWYPQWEMVVLTRARQYHKVVVVTWEPRSTGPIATGSMLEIWRRGGTTRVHSFIHSGLKLWNRDEFKYSFMFKDEFSEFRFLMWKWSLLDLSVTAAAAVTQPGENLNRHLQTLVDPPQYTPRVAFSLNHSVHSTTMLKSTGGWSFTMCSRGWA